VLVEGEQPIVELSLGEVLRAVAAAGPEQIALKEPTDPTGLPGRSWTYAQLLAEAERAARAMLVRFRPGEHIAIWSGNRPEWLIAQYGAALAGLVVVAINPANREK
jgi:acyl-CoA synthetase (AMP-forming)/AMP-acid ligase II